jgi:hypothetical protein
MPPKFPEPRCTLTSPGNGVTVPGFPHSLRAERSSCDLYIKREERQTRLLVKDIGVQPRENRPQTVRSVP